MEGRFASSLTEHWRRACALLSTVLKIILILVASSAIFRTLLLGRFFAEGDGNQI